MGTLLHLPHESKLQLALAAVRAKHEEGIFPRDQPLWQSMSDATLSETDHRCERNQDQAWIVQAEG